MSYALMHAVDQSLLARREKVVARHLVSFARDDGSSIYPRVERLSQMSGYCARSVQAALRALCEGGVLEVVQRRAPYRATEYRFHVEALPGFVAERVSTLRVAKAGLK